MRTFRIQIISDRYPLNYESRANDWPAAVSKALRRWKKEGKNHKKLRELKIVVVKGEKIVSNVPL